MVTPIIPKTKNALFRVVDKFFIRDDKAIKKLYDIKRPLSKRLAPFGPFLIGTWVCLW
jgi:hypothetical protein